MALSASQRKANEKYIKENYRQVKLSMPNAEADALEQYCEAYGYTKAGFIRAAIKEKMERDEKTPLSSKIQDAQERAQEPAPSTGKDIER